MAASAALAKLAVEPLLESFGSLSADQMFDRISQAYVAGAAGSGYGTRAEGPAGDGQDRCWRQAYLWCDGGGVGRA